MARGWTVKSIYQERMNKKEKKTREALGVDQIPKILSGQRKWSEEHQVSEWSYLWELAERCAKAKEEDLHDGLYKAIRRRLVTPALAMKAEEGKEGRKSQQMGYTKCLNCKTEEWVTIHALIECTDIQEVWKKCLRQEQSVTARDIFRVDSNGNKKDRYISYGKKGEKKKATLSEKEIVRLATLKEVVDEVEKRVKKKVGWKKLTSQEWERKISNRIEKCGARQKERKEGAERKKQQEETGVG